jgi:hypothetical protein
MTKPEAWRRGPVAEHADGLQPLSRACPLPIAARAATPGRPHSLAPDAFP